MNNLMIIVFKILLSALSVYLLYVAYTKLLIGDVPGIIIFVAMSGMVLFVNVVIKRR